MKRLFAIMMALVLMLSLAVSVSADENVGSITITNATKDHTYSIYKIFDASYGVGGSISYTIEETTSDGEPNPIFTSMFGNGENPYFTYDADNGYVQRKEGTLPSDIVDYLEGMIKAGTYTTAAEPITATSETVKFENLPYGYYIIDKGNNATVTITSNAPNAQVIDKNQIPGKNFSKLTWDEEDSSWKVNTSGNIGDILKFKVDFQATNYHGDKQIKYYTIDDKKGDALWVEFDSITVKVGDRTLGMGYYHFAGTDTDGANTGEWTPATNSDKWTNDYTKADWFLIHYDLDNFDIVIPWMTQYTFHGTTNGFNMEYGENSVSRFTSPVNVSITYEAGIEATAVTGGGQYNNVWNQAELFWTSDVTEGSDEPKITTSPVYGLGLDKIDGDATVHTHLSGAVFEIFRNEGCTMPVYVIPTGIEGVYVVDDPIADGQTTIINDINYQSARKLYNYSGARSNEITTQVNGKLVVLGLEEGTYYLTETKAPNGYNIMHKLVSVSVGGTGTTYTIIADESGKVYDTLEVEEGQYRHLYTVSPVTVENSKGVELPSTGGTGTMMMLSIGTMIAILFAVLLITHKKMSIYHD